jgi:hypothetical protein
MEKIFKKLIRANKKTGREESRRNEKQVEKQDHA